jgi:hypothetical protein
VTRRCIEEDLGHEAATDFESLLGHPIVDAFAQRCCSEPAAGKTVGPEAGVRTLYRLATTHDHRGATWHDARRDVVWLCAYGLHRSGRPDDAFKRFARLIDERCIHPDERDFQSLFEDRDRRFAEMLPGDAEAVLLAARGAAQTEQSMELGGQDPVAVYIERLESIEETFVCLTAESARPARLAAILAAIYPDATFQEWDLIGGPPHRASQPGEIWYRILRG